MLTKYNIEEKEKNSKEEPIKEKQEKNIKYIKHKEESKGES